MIKIKGGICAPKGFMAWGTSCGIKAGGQKDLAIIVSEEMCDAAAIYTKNKVKGAPLMVTKEHLADGKARALICNSGNANTCAPGGYDLAKETCRIVADGLGVRPEDVVVASTGVIGESLSIDNFEYGIPELIENMSAGEKASHEAALAIMTTDTVPKEEAVEFEIAGRKCHIGGIAKGSGMIHPDMATMLSFITTDVRISPELLYDGLKECADESFNQISVDGDTSTNDNVIIMANGMSGCEEIKGEEGYEIFKEALREVMVTLAKAIARDGEGAGKLIECLVVGAPDNETARAVSKSVISSDLLKAAVFGGDANWGRILCAVGNSKGEFDADNIDVDMGSETGMVAVCRGSAHEPYSEERASQILAEQDIKIKVDLNQGDGQAVAWGCDLTYEYVKINGDYRS